MGKLIRFLTILIFIDLFFVATGQLFTEDTSSLTSIIFSALFNLQDFTFTTFFSEIIGDLANLFNSTTGLASLLLGGAVVVGALLTKDETLKWIPVALTLGLITSDFIILFVNLRDINPVLAVFTIAPICIIYALTVLEWLRGKD